MFIVGCAVAALVLALLAARRWHEMNSKDLGYMSQRWLAEYNAQHP